MAPSLNVLNDDILHVLCEHLLLLNDRKKSAVSFACSSKRMNEVSTRHIFRSLDMVIPWYERDTLERLAWVQEIPRAQKWLRSLKLVLSETYLIELLGDTDFFQWLASTKLIQLKLLERNQALILPEFSRSFDLDTMSSLRTFEGDIQVGLLMLKYCPNVDELVLRSQVTRVSTWPFEQYLTGIGHIPQIRLLSVNLAIIHPKLLRDIVRFMPNLQELSLGPCYMTHTDIAELSVLVEGLRQLRKLAIPDNGSSDLSHLADTGVDYKVYVETAARRLFCSSSTLGTITFARPHDEHCILGVRRAATGDVEGLEWLKANRVIRRHLARGSLQSSDGEDIIDTWVAEAGGYGPHYLNLFGA